MSSWQKEPPTYRQWRDAKNHGFWWVKFILSKEYTERDETGALITWPEAWYTDIVMITSSYSNGLRHIMQEVKGEEPDYSGITLHARGNVIKDIDLSNPEATKDMYWQPVISPLDDTKDQRPVI